MLKSANNTAATLRGMIAWRYSASMRSLLQPRLGRSPKSLMNSLQSKRPTLTPQTVYHVSANALYLPLVTLAQQWWSLILNRLGLYEDSQRLKPGDKLRSSMLLRYSLGQTSTLSLVQNANHAARSCTVLSTVSSGLVRRIKVVLAPAKSCHTGSLLHENGHGYTYHKRHNSIVLRLGNMVVMVGY